MTTLVVSTGKAIITNRIKGAGTEPLNVSWGTGAGTTADSDTSLFAEADASGAAIGSGARVAGTSTRVTTTTTDDTYQVVGTITTLAPVTVTNAGLFDSATGGVGNLFLKGEFIGVVLGSGDSIQFTFKAQLV